MTYSDQEIQNAQKGQKLFRWILSIFTIYETYSIMFYMIESGHTLFSPTVLPFIPISLWAIWSVKFAQILVFIPAFRGKNWARIVLAILVCCGIIDNLSTIYTLSLIFTFFYILFLYFILFNKNILLFFKLKNDNINLETAINENKINKLGA